MEISNEIFALLSESTKAEIQRAERLTSDPENGISGLSKNARHEVETATKAAAKGKTVAEIKREMYLESAVTYETIDLSQYINVGQLVSHMNGSGISTSGQKADALFLAFQKQTSK